VQPRRPSAVASKDHPIHPHIGMSERIWRIHLRAPTGGGSRTYRACMRPGRGHRPWRTWPPRGSHSWPAAGGFSSVCR